MRRARTRCDLGKNSLKLVAGVQPTALAVVERGSVTEAQRPLRDEGTESERTVK